MPPQTDTTSSDDQPATKKDLRLLATELRGEMAILAAELRAEMAILATQLRAEMHERFSNQTRTVLVGQFLSNMTLAGLLIAAFKL